MKEKGTIYVVMPAYNVERFLATAFDSLLAQTYTDWVCLCMNDGSSDKTYEVMQKYAALDTRIKIYSQENQGLTKTMNTLLNMVKGPYLSFLDADDAYHPQMLEVLMNTMVWANADVVECGVRRFVDTVPGEFLQPIESSQNEIQVLENMNIFLTHKTSVGAWIPKWNKLYDFDKVKTIRFSEQLCHEDDYFYNSLVHTVIKKKVLVPYPFYFYRHNSSSLCGNVNWKRYQTSGINRIKLSYDYFIAGGKCGEIYQKAFLNDLSQDAYRMIVRKPIKCEKNKDTRRQIYNNAKTAMQDYLSHGIVQTQFLKPMARFHIWLLVHNWYYLTLLMAKLS